MLSSRFALVLVLLVFAIACSDDHSPSDSPSPIAPTPVATPPPPVATAPPSTQPPAPPPPAQTASVAIPVGAEFLGNRAFNPGTLDVTVGTTVTWTNNDSTSHTSTSDAPGWNSGIVAPGGTFSFRFENTGAFPYHCAIHPGMVGTVVVRAE